MLISFSCENILSFKDEQNISLVATNKKKDNILPHNLLHTPDDKMTLLKSAIIFGANGSGKTNFLAALYDMYKIVVHSLEKLKSKDIGSLTGFLLDHESKNNCSEYEIEFYAFNNIRYRYGFSFRDGKIEEEWLYYSRSRETLLFHREHNKIIEVNNNFKEAMKFIDKSQTVQQTKDNTPFLSVLASFDGEHSNAVLQYFLSFQFLGTSDNDDTLLVTLNLWKDNTEFREWALPVLNSIGIQDIRFELQINATIEEMKKKILLNKEQVVELDPNNQVEKKFQDKTLHLLEGLMELVVTLPQDMTESPKEEIDLSTIKLVRVVDGDEYALPFGLESTGTKKILHHLGSMYNTCKNGGTLLIDEFDVGFHTLLSKYIFRKFHESSFEGQVIATTHDTSLMDTGYFRRDQIWLTHKNYRGESELYSLVEFKELAANIINKNYSKEYLNGFYEAIPLFEDLNSVDDM